MGIEILVSRWCYVAPTDNCLQYCCAVGWASDLLKLLQQQSSEVFQEKLIPQLRLGQLNASQE